MKTTKHCTRCKTTKIISEFGKNKSKQDGLGSYCCICLNEISKEYQKTKKGVISSIYASQIQNSKRREHRLPEYTKKELREWIFSQQLFHELYSEWVNSGHLKRLKPSVDRKHDDIHYCMTNIQLMTWQENKQKGHDDMRSGKIKHGHNPQREVNQYNLDGSFVTSFISIMEAQRSSSVCQSNITQCCKGKRNNAGGYVWEYKG